MNETIVNNTIIPNQKSWMATILFFVALIGMSPKLSAAGEPQSLPVSPLVIEGANGFYEFDVELAKSTKEHSIGLMYRHQMDDKHGMLFLNQRVRFNSFWMKNTYISLDIIFIRFDGTISNVVANTIPLSLESINSTAPVLAILELNAGQAARMGLRVGDGVYHDIFDNYPPEIHPPGTP